MTRRHRDDERWAPHFPPLLREVGPIIELSSVYFKGIKSNLPDDSS
jgi:hypothetical protein